MTSARTLPAISTRRKSTRLRLTRAGSRKDTTCKSVSADSLLLACLDCLTSTACACVKPSLGAAECEDPMPRGATTVLQSLARLRHGSTCGRRGIPVGWPARGCLLRPSPNKDEPAAIPRSCCDALSCFRHAPYVHRTARLNRFCGGPVCLGSGACNCSRGAVGMCARRVCSAATTECSRGGVDGATWIREGPAQRVGRRAADGSGHGHPNVLQRCDHPCFCTSRAMQPD